MESLSNALEKEQSLYLKQHATNPVHWQPWSKAVFDLAEKWNKPVLVSIGYAACHWCHVMERECFEDPYLASLMNKHFVCIKVDREEHPEVDQIYMEAVLMIQQHGGWPLNVFCLPDGRPFFGGTYFPPEDKGQGIIPWPQLLMRIANHYTRAKHELEENADNILKNMAIANVPVSPDTDLPTNTILIEGAQHILKAYDPEWGGFSQAPKFPPAKILEYLLRVRNTPEAKNIVSLNENLDQAVYNTLIQMAYGGLYDQVGGGFFRYSVDRGWAIPHFEKMLYDNACLIDIYAKAYRHFQEPLFKSIIEETIDWLDREMLTPQGLYASSLDADSPEGEGYYYVWKPSEIEAILGADASNFCQTYGVTPDGNFDYNTTHLRLYAQYRDNRDSFKNSRQKLLAFRSQRKAPTRDNKQLVAWNSLLATALVHASIEFNNTQWLEKAKTLIDTLWTKASAPEEKLASVLYDGIPHQPGNLSDCAYYMQSCLALASAMETFKLRSAQTYIDRTLALLQTVEEDFGDPHQYGFFFSTKSNDSLITRKKEWWDSAIPAANATLLEVFSALYTLTGDTAHLQFYETLAKPYAALIQQSPGGAASAACAMVSRSAAVASI